MIKEEKLSNDETTYFNRKENILTLDNRKLVIAKGALHLSTFFLLSLNDKQNKNNEEFSKVYDIINSIGSNIQTYTQKHMPNFDDAVISNISNKKISEIISDADPTLISIMSEVLEKDEELNKKRIEIEGNEIYSKKIYAPYGVHYVDNNTYKLNFEEESDGTKKLFILMPTVFQILENGGYLFIDELDSSLHQDIIIDIIIKLFCNNALNKKKAKLRYKKKLKLKATVQPKNATNKKVKWYVSNKKYAKVTQKGVVRAKKKGIGHTVKVYAKAKDKSKKKAYCKVRIYK